MIFTLIIFLFSNSSSESSEIVEYKGNKIIFKLDSSLVCIYGAAEAEFGKLHVWADTLKYYLNDKFLDARGEVHFYDGKNNILAKRMTYNVGNEIGTAYKAKTEVEVGWFYGEKIRYIEGKTLKISNGYYTTCEFDPPHYWFYSPNMRVNIDQDIVAEPVVLLVGNIPLFFIPFWFYPLKRERSSGFITPSFGSSSYEGKYIEDIGWYQTLGPYADATISMNFFTKRGIENKISGRWKLSPYGDGTLTGRYIKEREGGKERWTMTLNNRSRLPGGIKLNLYSDIASDNEYFKDYEIGEVKGLIRDISYGGNISANILGFGIYGVADYRENVRTDILRKKWPSINIRFPRFSFGILNLSSASKYIRDENKHWGAGIKGDANIGFNLSPFNVNLSFSAKNDYYEREDVSINHWNSSISIKTRLYGLSFFGIGPISKFRHVITPSISASYAPESDSFEVTPLLGFSKPVGRKSLGLSLSNLFQCRIGESKYDFASLSFRTSYQPIRRKFSNISIFGNFWIGKHFRQRYSTSYDLYAKIFGDKFVTTDFKYGTSLGEEPLDIALIHTVKFTQEKRIQQADFRIKLNVTPKWRVNLNTHYDFEERRVTRSSIGLIRDLHCWELSMSYNTFGDNWDYNISLRLKQIPEVKVERGTFRTLLP